MFASYDDEFKRIKSLKMVDKRFHFVIYILYGDDIDQFIAVAQIQPMDIMRIVKWTNIHHTRIDQAIQIIYLLFATYSSPLSPSIDMYAFFLVFIAFGHIRNGKERKKKKLCKRTVWQRKHTIDSVHRLQKTLTNLCIEFKPRVKNRLIFYRIV